MDKIILRCTDPNAAENSNTECQGCLQFFKKILFTFNSPIDTQQLLQTVCEAVIDHFSIRACQFLIFNRQKMNFENIVSMGLSSEYLENSLYQVDDAFLKNLKTSEIKAEEIFDNVSIGDKTAYDKEGLQFLVTVPLKRGIQMVGIVHLLGAEYRALNYCEIKILEIISEFATGVLINSVFTTTLKKVTDAVHTSLDTEDVLNSIVNVVTDKLRVKGCVIRLFDKNTNKLNLKAASGLSDSYLNKGPVFADKSISQVLKGECVAIYDAVNDERLQYPEEAGKEGIGSILCIPLLIYKKIIGDLRVYTHKPYEFSDNEINLMMAVGEQCALAIRDAQMYTGIKEKYEDLISDFHQWFDK